MSNLDASMDPMEHSRFSAIYGPVIKRLTASTGLKSSEVTCLILIYYKFVKANGPTARKMTKKQMYQIFLSIFNVGNVKVVDRTMATMTKDTKYISPEAWISLFEIYTTKNLEMRMRFAFEVYNTKGTDVIDREQVGVACDSFFHGDDEDEINELKLDMTEFIMKKFDLDKDGVISYEDYSTVVTRQPELVDFLGYLFPARDVKDLMAHCINFDTILSSLLGS
ncbi:hypothetical protein KR074_012253 [Drosophila pseudoananassae]|nr:hypothetical protein KR074_012253 [Drosophila pseudoananassae]